MATNLSKPSPLRTGRYKTTTKMFFTASKLLEAQITEIFDNIWPIVTAIKNLRWQVQGYYKEYDNDIKSNADLTKKFVENKDKSNRPNLYRICISESWENQEFYIAQNLLTNIFACYENWAEGILATLQVDPKLSKKLQFPNEYQPLLTSMQANGNPILIDSFYDTYKNSNKNYNLGHLQNYLFYYRYFKECRNSIIHTGGTTTANLITAYNNIKNLQKEDIDVNEIPETFETDLDNPMRISLRGVVGFSQLILKIVSTFDVEFITCQHADEYFCNRIKEEFSKVYPTSTLQNRPKEVLHVVQKGRFKKPEKPLPLYDLLKNNNIMR